MNLLKSIIITTTLMNVICSPTTAQDIPGCIIYCCVNCKANYNCKICYILNKDDKDRCPCIEDLSPRIRATLTKSEQAGYKLGQQEKLEEEDNESEIVFRSDKVFSKSSPQRSSFEGSSAKSKRGKLSSIPLCKPSCCPNSSCTEVSCPLCYRKFRSDPKNCHCVNTGKLGIFA